MKGENHQDPGGGAAKGRTPCAVSGAVAGCCPCRGCWELVPGVGAGRAAAGDIPGSVGSL